LIGLRLPKPFIAYQKAPACDGDAATVEAFARSIVGCPQIIGRYVEGPGPERPELAKALEIARQHLGALILPALDHIAGDAVALTAIQQSGVEFVACDAPKVTRDALVELLASASSRPSFMDRQNSGATVELPEHASASSQFDNSQPIVTIDKISAAPKPESSVRETIRDIQRSGATTLRAIAKALQERGVKTPTGRTAWQATQVARMMDRAGNPPGV
jgi:hypothetical protein